MYVCMYVHSKLKKQLILIHFENKISLKFLVNINRMFKVLFLKHRSIFIVLTTSNDQYIYVSTKKLLYESRCHQQFLEQQAKIMTWPNLTQPTFW